VAKDPSEFHSRVYVACSAAGLFLLADAAFVFAALKFASINLGLPYVVAASVPASAALILILVAAALPGLIPGGRFQAPLQWTLPLVYAALTFLSAILILQLGSTSSLSAPARALAPARIWLTGLMLVTCGIVHVASLSLAIKLRGRSEQ
jgi:hypothetical protein